MGHLGGGDDALDLGPQGPRYDQAGHRALRHPRYGGAEFVGAHPTGARVRASDVGASASAGDVLSWGRSSSLEPSQDPQGRRWHHDDAQSQALTAPGTGEAVDIEGVPTQLTPRYPTGVQRRDHPNRWLGRNHFRRQRHGLAGLLTVDGDLDIQDNDTLCQSLVVASSDGVTVGGSTSIRCNEGSC